MNYFSRKTEKPLKPTKKTKRDLYSMFDKKQNNASRICTHIFILIIRNFEYCLYFYLQTEVTALKKLS